MSTPTAKGYFSGCGGMEVGLMQAGVNLIQSLDLDMEATACMKANSHYFSHNILTVDMKDKTVLEQPGSDIIVAFRATHFLVTRNNRSKKYPGVQSRIRYSDAFSFNNLNCDITYICSLLNPYKSEILHKKSTHDSRVGIPSVYEYLKG